MSYSWYNNPLRKRLEGILHYFIIIMIIMIIILLLLLLMPLLFLLLLNDDWVESKGLQQML